MPASFRPLQFLRLFVVASLVLFASQAWAADSLEKNAELLRSSDDFRVRTQAALALGASSDGRAVTPLCQALGDDNRTVRIATATALARLRKGGEACLKRRLEQEKDEKVLSAIERALQNLGGAGAEPAIGPGTRFFVAIDKVSGPERLNDPVRAAFVKGAAGRSDVGFAPAGISRSEGEALLKKFPSAKGFVLSPKLSKPKYEGGILQVKMSVAIMSYPGNALLGSFSKTVGIGGVSEPDEAAENDLVVTAAEESMKQFLKIAPSLDE